MGVTGLLNAVCETFQKIDISSLRGSRVAVDSYVWLHKACYGCCVDICLGKPTTRYVQYCLGKLRILQNAGVIPVMVFDGARLPSKFFQEKKRERERSMALERGMEAHNKQDHSLARRYFAQAVDVTAEMARKLMDTLEQMEVEFIVAPYEADPELTYLVNSGYVDYALSEDSDLIVYGCEKILYKIRDDGRALLYLRSNLADCTSLRLRNVSDPGFVAMCVLSGCDYVDSVKGLGLRKARDLIGRFRDPARVIAYAKADSRLQVPDGFEQDFYKAFFTFKYQTIFCPRSQSMRWLRPMDKIDSLRLPKDLGFLGKKLSRRISIEICSGRVHPQTHFPFPKPQHSGLFNKDPPAKHDSDAPSTIVPFHSSGLTGSGPAVQRFRFLSGSVPGKGIDPNEFDRTKPCRKKTGVLRGGVEKFDSKLVSRAARFTRQLTSPYDRNKRQRTISNFNSFYSRIRDFVNKVSPIKLGKTNAGSRRKFTGQHSQGGSKSIMYEFPSASGRQGLQLESQTVGVPSREAPARRRLDFDMMHEGIAEVEVSEIQAEPKRDGNVEQETTSSYSERQPLSWDFVYAVDSSPEGK